MAADLESPIGYADLYLARGEEVGESRPVMTGDVFVEVPVRSPTSDALKAKSVMIVQHPCALRSDGVNLLPGVLVAEVRRHRPIDDWTTHGKLMPLPELRPETDSGQRHQAALFDVLGIVPSRELLPARRIGCMSDQGICLALQRFNHHNSRVVVPSWQILEVVGGPLEEIDITEEWCETAAQHAVPSAVAATDCLAWLREDLGSGRTRQSSLEQPEQRSKIRREARQFCRERSPEHWAALLQAA